MALMIYATNIIKKRTVLLLGEDENAMETFVALQKAKDAEDELRQLNNSSCEATLLGKS